MQQHRGLAGGRAAFLEIELVQVRDLEPSGAVGDDLRIEREALVPRALAGRSSCSRSIHRSLARRGFGSGRSLSRGLRRRARLRPIIDGLALGIAHLLVIVVFALRRLAQIKTYRDARRQGASSAPIRLASERGESRVAETRTCRRRTVRRASRRKPVAIAANAPHLVHRRHQMASSSAGKKVAAAKAKAVSAAFSGSTSAISRNTAAASADAAIAAQAAISRGSAWRRSSTR